MTDKKNLVHLFWTWPCSTTLHKQYMTLPTMSVIWTKPNVWMSGKRPHYSGVDGERGLGEIGFNTLIL